LEGPEDDDVTAVVCRVFDKNNESFESGESAFGVGDTGSSFTKHYPGEFSGASQPYKAAAPYRVVWLGSVGAFPDAVDATLAETSFEIDDKNRPYFGPGNSPPAQGWPEEWHSGVRFAVPPETGPYRSMPHKIVLELHGRRGQRADGAIKAVVRRGEASFESELDPNGLTGVRFEAHNLEPGDKPHYYIFFPDGFDDAPETLDDGEYELRWMERHAMGWRLRHEPHAFEIRDGEVVVP
jgi:hypothetical protein